ncbi:hypothetical protein CkaCkLH20_09149 [Colletotrichum karsti]|uniref:Lea domain protein n=1 Tax=Colletotrichum karsti TaxID=1095194 RepID=A0A9P6I3J3_9PEZI|nr:uncharacterized protein CkaCkLH20_09149 [Colletotrichum karsti]KAF9873336.1 hypothetical protein CkaCkLH20_09149 [Colletotrichum karsti]
MSSPREKNTKYASDEETSEDTQQQQQPQRRQNRNKGRQMQRRQQSGPLDAVGGQDVGQTVQGVTGGAQQTLGNVAGGALQNQGGGGGDKSDTLRLRLDLNLDIEITLKARIHGDLELALFKAICRWVPFSFLSRSWPCPGHPGHVPPHLAGETQLTPNDLVQTTFRDCPMMTASPPTQPIPPTTQFDKPRESPASTSTVPRSLQKTVPENEQPSSHTMQRTGPRPASDGDPEHASRHDEYEVVEVEDDDAGVEEVPRRNVRPPLPRLNSSSRAPGSPAPPPETNPPQPPPRRSSNASTPQPQQGGPFHLSREIPIPIRSSSTQGQSAHKAPPTSSADTADTTDSRTDEGTQDSKESKETSPGASSPKGKEPEGKNAPINIPKVTPVASGLTIPPNLADLAQGLDGKYVDEFGNILDWNGQVLGRVEGDLPSMIGRPVSVTGEIFSEDGEVVGYVAENDTIPPAPPSPQPIQGMGEGLKVDHMGNILDSNNNVVGHFDGAHMAKSVQKPGQTGGQHSHGARPANNPQADQNCSCGRPKPSSAPSPSEVFMDVKSTHDGIQLIIKIPTVFNGGGVPNIHIGTG